MINIIVVNSIGYQVGMELASWGHNLFLEWILFKMLKMLSASAVGCLLAMNVSAATFSTLIDINQVVSVAPSEPGQATSYTGSINMNSLVDGVSFTSGQYVAFVADFEFYFSQQSYLDNTPLNIAYSHNRTNIFGAGSLDVPFEYQNELYNYMVRIRDIDYYQDQRPNAAATLEISGGVLSETHSTYYGYEYQWSAESISYNVPPGTTGLIERIHSSDTTLTNDSGTALLSQMWGSLPLYLDNDGNLNFTVTATSAYSELLGVSVYLDYQENPNFEPPAAVPLPAAAWLFLSGLFGLIGFTRRG